MKNEETGRVGNYSSKRKVVFSKLMMCENAPLEWLNVSEMSIDYFKKSERYKRAGDKEAAIEKFRLIQQKQRLWNEVLKIEKGANAQLGRLFEFALPKEWDRQKQIDLTTSFIQKNFVVKGMCADWSIHDKEDGNPHVHLLVTMRPFKQDFKWGNKETKDWEFIKDTGGEILIDASHPNWWQDKRDPLRQGIRIPILDNMGNQKVDSRNRKQWKRVSVDATGWNNPKNCELWRSEWARECNLHLPKEKSVDHRSYKRQGKIEIPMVHEGAEARKIDEKYFDGESSKPSWKVAENQVIKKQNTIILKIQEVFQNKVDLLHDWKEQLDDFRRKQRSNSNIREYDIPDRRTAGVDESDISRIGVQRSPVNELSKTESRIAAIKRRIADAALWLASYRRNIEYYGNTMRQDKNVGNRKSAMARINGQVEQREYSIAIAEQRIVDAKNQIRKVREIDERICKLKERRANSGSDKYGGRYADRSRANEYGNCGIAGTTERIGRIKREIEQREQSRESKSISERLEANRRIMEEREKTSKLRRFGDRSASR
jgi:hypothetical protein